MKMGSNERQHSVHWGRCLLVSVAYHNGSLDMIYNDLSCEGVSRHVYGSLTHPANDEVT